MGEALITRRGGGGGGGSFLTDWTPVVAHGDGFDRYTTIPDNGRYLKLPVSATWDK